jgi:hypothetical protein
VLAARCSAKSSASHTGRRAGLRRYSRARYTNHRFAKPFSQLTVSHTELSRTAGRIYYVELAAPRTKSVIWQINTGADEET